ATAVGDLLAGQPFKVTELNYQALRMRKTRECPTSPGPIWCGAWVLEYRSRFYMREDHTMLPGNCERAHSIDGPAPHPHQQPRAYRAALRIIAVGLLPRLQKDVMQQVFGITAIP